MFLFIGFIRMISPEYQILSPFYHSITSISLFSHITSTLYRPCIPVISLLYHLKTTGISSITTGWGPVYENAKLVSTSLQQLTAGFMVEIWNQLIWVDVYIYIRIYIYIHIFIRIYIYIYMCQAPTPPHGPTPMWPFGPLPPWPFGYLYTCI